MPAAGENGRIGRIGPVFRRSEAAALFSRAFRAAGVTGEIRTQETGAPRGRGAEAGDLRKARAWIGGCGRKGPKRRQIGPPGARSVERKARTVEETGQSVEGIGRSFCRARSPMRTHVREFVDKIAVRWPAEPCRALKTPSRFFNAHRAAPRAVAIGRVLRSPFVTRPVADTELAHRWYPWGWMRAREPGFSIRRGRVSGGPR